jgi:aryl-alcohol dehydrogenase-like predicted oxidoreductase
MKYRILGDSGLYLSRLTLGTMTFGAPEWGSDEAESHRIIRRFVEAGGNSIDGADVYSGGRAEEIVGSYLAGAKRDDLVIASKCFFPTGSLPNQFGVSRKRIVSSCEASLRRLRTDYIDVYYVHGPDPVTPLEETVRGLDDLVRQGKARYTGCSNLFGWQIAKACGIADRLALGRFVAGQYLYNLIHREAEREIIPAAVDHGLGILCYSPLGGGLLTGKYAGMQEPAKGTRLAHRTQVDGPRFWHDKGFRAAEAVAAVARSSGQPAVRLAIAWPLRRRFVTSVVVGAKSVAQLEEILPVGDWDVPEDAWKALEEKTRPADDYLNWFAKGLLNRFYSAAEFHYERRDLP